MTARRDVGRFYADQPTLPAFFNNPDRACAAPHVQPEWFFPETRGRANGDGPGKDTCRDCPFRVGCREFAIDTGQAGIWGATTEEERAAIKTRRAGREGRAA